MRNRTLAILLALVLLLAALPVSAGAASGSGAVKGKSASISITGEGVSLVIKWDKVSGATGYEYSYNLFWKEGAKSSDYTVKSTEANSATIRLKDYGNIDVRVRAYRKVGGKKLYGEWAGGTVKRASVDKMIVKQLKKKMQSKDLFLKATSGTAHVRAGAGEEYGVLTTMSRPDEARATGSFKRDENGTWWSEVYASVSQNTTFTGWVSRKGTAPVWY